VDSVSLLAPGPVPSSSVALFHLLLPEYIILSQERQPNLLQWYRRQDRPVLYSRENLIAVAGLILLWVL
jgi:hypothetical protein